MQGRVLAGLFVVLALLAPAARAGAEVGDEDLRRAAAALEAARAEAGAAGDALAAGRAEAARLRDRLEQIAGEVAAAEGRYAAARRDALARAGALYVAAGNGASWSADAGSRMVRQAYAAAVAARDAQVLNTLAAAAADRERLRRSLRDEASLQAELALRLEALAAEAGEALAAAEAEYSLVREAWEAQEAARRAALAATSTTTTTTGPSSITTTTGPGTTTATTALTTTTTTASTTAPTTTTTAAPTTSTVPPVEGGEFPPPVERWRPLVSVYFSGQLVAEALSIIRCESYGDPDVVNPASGASGLFQHMPAYWPERAAAAGFPGASIFDPEANIAGAAWLVGVSVESGLPPWYFWSCRR